MPEAPPRIALLGWGSLLWDKRPEFDDHHEGWQLDGPELPLEFSRVSSSRKRALTLVIDADYGALCHSAWAISRRREPEDAIADLKCREGTRKECIGRYFRNGTHRCGASVPESIPPWAERRGIDVVVWTGLSSNFKKEAKKPFSVQNAIRYLRCSLFVGPVEATCGNHESSIEGYGLLAFRAADF